MTYSRTDQPFMLEKPLPSAPDAERTILGAVLLDQNVMAQAAELLTPDDFYSPMHRLVFKAMLALFERGDKIDPILIGEDFKKEGQLENIGGVATIVNLTYGLPHLSSIETYARIIIGKREIRDLVKTCSEITSRALAEEDPVEDIKNFAESKIFEVCDNPSKSAPEQVAALAFASVERVAEYRDKGVKAVGLPTGFTELDKMTGGLQPTDLIIVAARPSQGKTALCLTIAQNSALQAGAVVAVFSLEMTKAQLADRMICSEARIDLHRYRTGFLTNEDMDRARQAAKTLAQAKIIIDDTAGIAPVQLLAKARRIYAEQKRLDLIVVDYLQLMTGSNPKQRENRQQEVSAISRELKSIAKYMNVPVIALSQLSRAPEARNPPKPQMSDLRESGAIEQDADVVAFIYRDEYYKPSEENAGIAELIISKQRNGPTGTVKLTFLKEFTRFENYFEETHYSPPSRSSDEAEDDPRFR